jgi:hypothetical protein
MKFTKLRISVTGQTSVDLPVVGATPSGPFLLKNVDGLGPAAVDVSIADTVNQGGVYLGRRPQNREIVARIGLQPDWNTGQTSSDLRNTLYGLMSPGYNEHVLVQIMDGDTVVAQVEGQVSRFEAAIFSKDPEVQITIPCFSPYFTAPNAIVAEPELVVEGGSTTFIIDNPGTAPSGYSMTMKFGQAHSGSLQISDDNPFGARFSLNHGFVLNDSFVFNTTPGNRGISKIPAGSSTAQSILGDYSYGPWFQLHGGENKLKVNNTMLTWSGFKFMYTPAYWGV